MTVYGYYINTYANEYIFMDERISQLKLKADNIDQEIGKTKDSLLIRARNLVCCLLNEYTLLHTKLVVKLVKERSNDMIDEITAWLHDIGRAIVEDETHREIGAEWAKEWLNNFEISVEEKERIIDGILNHGTSSSPKTKTGKLLRYVDKLSVFEEAWLYVLIAHFKRHKKEEKLKKKLEEKLEFIKENGTKDDYEKCKAIVDEIKKIL